ncbi:MULTISPECIES: L,D-transpeptidase family protein [Nonomuraea]|uniref:L,D-transpeptidase family protein n=1 Tax=Nonomuraea ferruginea TaxID=46174 RepID=A0ABT4TCN3_9ACTN|nr:L,D-transpeptidase family protein [Nonomuraea ferruginea]MDA0647287.1 L,D-transpeptidase family protein [Nonomuraea ferruginea]
MINACRILALVLCLALPTAAPFISPAAADDGWGEDEEIDLRPGDRGEDVRWLQQRLRQMGYLFTKATGSYDKDTRFAVWAFRKSQGMQAANIVDTDVWRRLTRPRKVRPLVKTGSANRVEIDLRRQLLTVYRRGRPVLISHTSTGAGVRFCQGGRCRVAVTPIGDFRVYKRAPGWTTGPLGSMYNSLYFVGGVAIHGGRKVPSWPGSHGCVRLPMSIADRLYRMVTIGEPVYVRQGHKLKG